MAQKLTKLEAAARLEVSQSTIDRMIQRGDLQVQKERHGNRHRIWVVLDESREASTGVFDSSPNESGHSPPERVDMSETLELTVLRERVKNLEELVEHHRGLLKDSEWRYQQLFEQLSSNQRTVESLTRALPAGANGTLSQRRRWWRFGKGSS
jgi:hypothetical protein